VEEREKHLSHSLLFLSLSFSLSRTHPPTHHQQTVPDHNNNRATLTTNNKTDDVRAAAGGRLHFNFRQDVRLPEEVVLLVLLDLHLGPPVLGEEDVVPH